MKTETRMEMLVCGGGGDADCNKVVKLMGRALLMMVMRLLLVIATTTTTMMAMVMVMSFAPCRSCCC